MTEFCLEIWEREKQRKSNDSYCIMKLHHLHHFKGQQLNHPLSLNVIISALHIDFCGGIRSVNLFITWGAGTPRAFWISYHAISLRLHFRSLPSWNRQSTVRRTFGLVTCLLLSATTWLGLKVWCNTTRIVGFPTVNKSHKHDETQTEGSGWYTVIEQVLFHGITLHGLGKVEYHCVQWISEFFFFSSTWGLCLKVDMDNLLANNSSFTHPADMEQKDGLTAFLCWADPFLFVTVLRVSLFFFF